MGYINENHSNTVVCEETGVPKLRFKKVEELG